MKDHPRPGRPRRITDGERLQLIALACERADEDGGRSTPTLNERVAKAQKRGVVSHISRSHYQRILQHGDLHPHRTRQWLHSPDPDFRPKVNEICDLYRNPPKDSVVLSIDEKPGIQVIERKRPDRPPRPGSLRRREFEYSRHGTQALFAALDVHTGKSIATCCKHRAQVAFNQAQGGRFSFHYTPIHASWVNQVELLFGCFSRECLRNASHTSTADLREKTMAFFEKRNRSPKPFKWSFRGFHLETGERKRKPGRKRHDIPPKPSHRCRDPVPTP